MKVSATIAGVVCAAAALWLAFTTYMDVSMAGFPDGHLTEYEAAVAAPLQIVTCVAVGFAVLLLILVFAPSSGRSRAVGLLLAVVAFGVVTMVAVLGVPWYFGTHLGLDTGVGG